MPPGFGTPIWRSKVCHIYRYMYPLQRSQKKSIVAGELYIRPPQGGMSFGMVSMSRNMAGTADLNLN